MRFTSNTYEVREIEKKTKAKGFSNIEVGDEIWFEIEMENTSGSRNGLYALTVKVHLHGNRGEDSEVTCCWKNSQNQFMNNIDNFVLEEVD